MNTEKTLITVSLTKQKNIKMKTNKFSWFITAILFVLYSCTYSQQSTKVPMDASRWIVTSDEFKFEEYLGVPSLYLPEGFAELKDEEFHNGIIEFDIAFPQSRGFPGIIFRKQDEQNYEEFYIRPHQSGNPDANQYTPVFNGLAGWQLYYGEGHAAPFKYKYDAWNHVKLVISGTVGEVYIDDMNNPLFQIYELKHGDVKGPIALKGNAKAHFANFSYTKMDAPELKLPVKELPALEKNVITNYRVSNAVKDADIIAKPWINGNEIEGISWAELSPEFTGTINIARVAKREENKNTALVKFTINSESDQVKRFEFGYSDNAQVFVNGKAIYLGNNTFRTRDYRYLGTIGYFDSVFLDLKKGDNEIIIALNEAFGGWGMKAKLENLDGIRIK